jgi:hypothetical protein
LSGRILVTGFAPYREETNAPEAPVKSLQPELPADL